jgi:hypothetical protein
MAPGGQMVERVIGGTMGTPATGETVAYNADGSPKAVPEPNVAIEVTGPTTPGLVATSLPTPDALPFAGMNPGVDMNPQTAKTEPKNGTTKSAAPKGVSTGGSTSGPAY